MKFTKRSQQGFALILVLLIGALMMIPVLMLLSAVAPRRTTVTGEAVSDIALASADGVVDKIATKINTFPTLLSSNSYITSNLVSMSDNVSMARFAIGYLLSTYLNGGYSSYHTDYRNYYGQAQLDAIQKSVSTYLYDTVTGKYYVVCDTSRYIASVGNVVGASGDVASKPIGDLATVTADGNMNVVSPTGMSGTGMGDSLWATDNRWIEIDTNTQFDNTGTNSDTTSRFIIRATAYPLSSNKDISGRMRTVQAEVFLGHVKVVPGGWPGVFADPLWSGGNLTMNSGGIVAGNIYASGNISLPSGCTINGNVQTGGDLSSNSFFTITGNVDAVGHVYFPSGGTVGGSIHSGDYVELNSTGQMTVVGKIIEAKNYIELDDQGITLNNPQAGSYLLKTTAPKVTMTTGVNYTLPAVPMPPPFDVTAALNAGKSTAIAAAGSAGILGYNTSITNPITVGASGSPLPYYVSGSVGTNAMTFNFAPIAGSTVAWYVGGNVDIRGTAALKFASPCTIYVGGTLSVSNDTTITGHGTIVANAVDVNGPIGRPAGDTQSNVAIIVGTSGLTTFSNGVNMPAIIYAPNGSVTLSSGGTISAGSIVARGDVNAPSLTNIGGNPPPFPGAGSGISFITNSGSSTAFKRSWKELISGKYTVTPSNFTNNNVPPNFPPVQVSGDFSQ